MIGFHYLRVKDTEQYLTVHLNTEIKVTFVYYYLLVMTKSLFSIELTFLNDLQTCSYKRK